MVCTALEQASSGRGGVGNIRPQSREPIDLVTRARGHGPDDFSPSRGRELRTSVDEPVRVLSLSFLFSLLPSPVPASSVPPLCFAI